MQNYKLSALKRQAGMTLIELTVVLLVLVGLAGLLVPYVSGFIDKTHDATGANSISELDNAILRYSGDKMRYPNKMENLISATDGAASADAACTGAGPGSVYCKLMTPAQFSALTLAAPSNMSLTMSGIETVLPADNLTTNATFEAVNTTPGSEVTIGVGSIVAAVAGVDVDGDAVVDTVEQHMAAAFGGVPQDYDTSCYDYVAFGIGGNNEMIGTQMHSAPIHFASQGAMGPVNKYNRFIAVFQVDKTTASVAANTVSTTTGAALDNPGCEGGTEAAKFVGTGMNMGIPMFIGAAANQKWVYDRIAAN